MTASLLPQHATTGDGNLPIVVIGAGPVGLAAGAHLLSRGLEPRILELGTSVAASVRRWAHVRLFSPWEELVDSVALEQLRRAGWEPPPGGEVPTGGELVERYLEPLGERLERQVRLGTRVIAVSRAGADKLESTGRRSAPFVVVVETPEGRDEVRAAAVIDASGTFLTPNPLGASGLPADGEHLHARVIRYGIPDALGAEKPRYVGKRVAVVGAGHSAMNVVLALHQLTRLGHRTRVEWITRSAPSGHSLDANSAAKSRSNRLEERAAELAHAGVIPRHTGFRLNAVRAVAGGVEVVCERGLALGPYDEIVAVTGYRPDLRITRELRLDLDEIVEAPRGLAPMIDPNVHSCGTVPEHGVGELAHPEPGYFCVGMKSYGRAPTFLLRTGYAQVRSVVTAVAEPLPARPVATAPGR